MGYDVHITRAEDWSDSEASPISLAEWKAYVVADPEMEMEGFADAELPDGNTLRYQNEGLTVWSGWSARTDENKAWFDHRRGRIVVKNPDEEIIKKMIAIASALGARVQGDDGEAYDESPRHFSQGQSPNETKSWWKRLLGR